MTPAGEPEVVLQPAATEVAWSGGRWLARGLGRVWVRGASGRWSAVGDDGPLGERMYTPAGLVTASAGPRPMGGYVVGATANGRRALGVLRRGERLLVHPSGAAAVCDGERVRAVAGPGRSLQAPTRQLVARSLRFGDDGMRVAGVDPTGDGWAVDLAGFRAHPRPGWPVHPDAWLDPDGWGTSPDGRVDLGLVEASVARNGPLLAGPGARVWDLRTASPRPEAGRVLLGATVPWRDGFVTIDFDTHAGHSLVTTPLAFRLPLAPDDLVSHVVAHPDHLDVASVLGEGVRVAADGSMSAVPPPPAPPDPPPVQVDTPAGRWQLAGAATVGSYRYAWSSDGWLLGWISTPSTRAISYDR